MNLGIANIRTKTAAKSNRAVTIYAEITAGFTSSPNTDILLTSCKTPSRMTSLILSVCAIGVPEIIIPTTRSAIIESHTITNILRLLKRFLGSAFNQCHPCVMRVYVHASISSKLYYIIKLIYFTIFFENATKIGALYYSHFTVSSDFLPLSSTLFSASSAFSYPSKTTLQARPSLYTLTFAFFVRMSVLSALS